MYIPRLAEKIFAKHSASDKVIMLLGARQVGKTTLIKNTLHGKNAVFLNFDIEVDKQRFLAASSIAPDNALKSFGSPDYLIIDEVQRLPKASQIIKGWHDADVKTKIVLLGSSNPDIVNQSVESLTGRNIKIYLPPLLFKESVAHQSWFSPVYSNEALAENFQPQIQHLLMQHLIFGSYPEVVTSVEKRELLQMLAFDYLYKDILQLGLLKTPDLIKKLLMLLAHQVGSEVSINEIATQLGATRATIERYIHLLEQTYVIFKLPAFSTNPRKEISKNQKIFFWDTGIRNAILNDFNLNEYRSDIGALWENWVIAEIAKENILSGNIKNLYFWRSRSGSEVDLIIREDDKIWAYEIKWANRKHRAKKAFFNAYNVEVSHITRNLKSDIAFLKG